MAVFKKKKNEKEKKPITEGSINLANPEDFDSDESEEAQKVRSVTRKIKVLRAFVFLIIAAFFIGGFSIFKDDISLENLRYLIKYFDLGESDLTSESDPIPMETDSDMVCGICKSGIAVLKTNSFEIYNYLGDQVFSASLSYATPAMIISPKSILTFDIGGKTAKIFNSYSLLKELNFDYEITSADISENGYFCIATAEKGYTSAVYIYNSDFDLIYRWASGNRFVTDVSISDRLPTICNISAVRSEGGEFASEVILIDPDEEKPIASKSLSGELVYAMEAISASENFVLTDSALRIVSSKENEELSIPVSSEGLKKFALTDEYAALVINSSIIGQNYDMKIYNDGLEEIFSFHTEKQILDFKVHEDNFFILTVGGYYVINPKSKSEDFIETDTDISTLIPISSEACAIIGDERIAFSFFG